MPRERAALAKRVSKISPSRACAGVTARAAATRATTLWSIAWAPTVATTPAGRARETASGAGAASGGPEHAPKRAAAATIRARFTFIALSLTG